MSFYNSYKLKNKRLNLFLLLLIFSIFLIPFFSAGKGGSTEIHNNIKEDMAPIAPGVLSIRDAVKLFSNKRNALFIIEEGVEKCYALNNQNNINYFIPIKTIKEWLAFKNHASSLGIDVEECIYDLLDDINLRADKICLEENIPCGPVHLKLNSLFYESKSPTDFSNKLKNLNADKDYTETVIIRSLVERSIDQNEQQVNSIIRGLNEEIKSKGYYISESNFRDPYGNPTPKGYLHFPYIESDLISFDDAWRLMGLAYSVGTSPLGNEALEGIQNGLSLIDRGYELSEEYRNKQRELTLEICGGSYCDIDSNGNNICEIGEPCAGDMKPSDDNDRDGVCEKGEECCAGDPEGCNLPSDYQNNNEVYHYQSPSESKIDVSNEKGYTGTISETWGTGGTNCFTYDTLIDTINKGKIRISELREGDEVLSYDNDKNQFVISTIEKLLIHENTTIWYYIIKTEHSSVKVNGIHRFYIGNDSYKKIEELNIGETIYIDLNGKLTPEKILSKERVNLSNPITVYNLELNKDGPRNYFANRYLVHNMK